MSETPNNGTSKSNNINGINALLSEVNSLVQTPIEKTNMKAPQEAVVEVVGQLEKAIQETSGKLQASLDNANSLRSQLALKEMELSNTQRKIQDLEDQHKIALTAAETGSSSQISELTAAHQKAINAKNENQKLMKANLNNRIENLESELTTQREQFSTLQSDKLSLENEKEGLESEIKKYKTQLSNAVKAIQSLKKKVVNYNKSYKVLEDQISQIYGKYSNNSGVLNTNTIIKKATGMNLTLGGAKKRKSKTIKSKKPKKSVKSKKSKKSAKKRV